MNYRPASILLHSFLSEGGRKGFVIPLVSKLRRSVVSPELDGFFVRELRSGPLDGKYFKGREKILRKEARHMHQPWRCTQPWVYILPLCRYGHQHIFSCCLFVKKIFDLPGWQINDPSSGRLRFSFVPLSNSLVSNP